MQSLSNADKRAAVEALAPRLQDAEAIYAEQMLVLRVRIRQMTIDDWGVTIRADVVPSKGFYEPFDLPDLGCAWQVLYVSDDRIAATYSGWRLYFHADLLADIQGFAETLSGSLDDGYRLREWIDEWYESRDY